MPTSDGRVHHYTPDFVIHASGDRWLLVEIKMTARRDDAIEGRAGLKAQALRDLETRNPGRVFYRIAFAGSIVPARISAPSEPSLGQPFPRDQPEAAWIRSS